MNPTYTNPNINPNANYFQQGQGGNPVSSASSVPTSISTDMLNPVAPLKLYR